MHINLDGGKRIELAVGDITHEAIDAIVSAANSSLMGGGGVDGAIHRAAGPKLLDECRALMANRGLLEDGEVVATGGGLLPARYVLHASGPVYEDGLHGEPEALASCYREAIRLADALGLTSLAFPSISTGVYGYPLDEAAAIALEAVSDALREARTIALVRFILFDEESFAAYRDAADRQSMPRR